MRLRTALNDYKRGDDAHYPGTGKRGTLGGGFSGHGDRLVHVHPDGYVRDYSTPLSGLRGLDRSRFGVETGDETHWFDDLDTVRQHYYRETTLVETEYDAGEFTIHQYDLTLDRDHVTHVELRGAVPSQARLVAFMTFAPEGQETRVGRLIHEEGGPEGTKAVEVFHRREHDYVTASTGLEDVRGQIPERFEEILSTDAQEYPREAVLNRYEDTHLSGDVVVTAPLEDAGRGARTTLVTKLSDRGDMDRQGGLMDLRECATDHESASEVRAAARERTEVAVPERDVRSGLVRADLRVLDLLRAPTGARIAGPETDPFFTNSGGYGYTWFRDDARMSHSLLVAADTLGFDVSDRLSDSAKFLCCCQLDDGTWPHRVWASDGSLAPGWANANVEGDDDSVEYQADQTATVTFFLATLLRERDLSGDLRGEIRDTVESAVAAMDESLADNGLPERCQNLWEDASGQFAHTAGCYLRAYAAVARGPFDQDLSDGARRSAETVLDGLDALWDAERGVYALRLDDGALDARLDSGSFAVVDGLAEFDAVADATLPDATLDRVAKHVRTALDGLYRDPKGSPVEGLIRYEDDVWRRRGQGGEKVWSLATAEGALAAATTATLLEDRGEDAADLLARAGDLYALLEGDGPLTCGIGYLAEQVYDDGTADSAAPLGYAHAVRLRATAVLAEADALPSATPAPEGPAERPRWTTGEKYGVGTVADHRSEEPSRVWFTLTEGALTEVRFPRVDLMNLRTLDFIVSCADGYTVRTHNESRQDDTAETVERRVEPTADDALLFAHHVEEQGDGRGHEWTLRVEYAADPDHDAVVADVSFEAADGKEYDVFAVADVALTNTGTRDRGLRLGRPGSYHLAARAPSAYVGDADEPLLVDEEEEGYSVAVAMAAAGRFDWATVDVAGSASLRELFSDGERPTTNEAVDDENVVLVGRLGGNGTHISETIALGFARYADTAGALGEAAGALAHGYEGVRERYVASWGDFLADRELPDCVAGDPVLANQYRSALMCLLAVEDKSFIGASIASPSVPWGEAVAAEEPKGYGYNFVWARDLYQVFTVFDAVGDLETATSQLAYIYDYQQDEEGFIPQNTYVNGITRWGGEQMDNISYPQVMAYHLWQRGVDFEDAPYDFEHVRRSADYVGRNGPETGQERWEEEAGYSPSSLAAEISGLACAAKLAVETDREADALVWLSLADHWANEVETWTATTTGTERHDQTPYYVRITRDGNPDAGHLRTLANGGPTLDERDIVDAGFLDLVRLGIKPADDPVVRNSVEVVDNTIRVDTPGPAFYRYNGDGYGERARGDRGAPWSVDNYGKGRLWPLLSGERGEYDLLYDGPGALDPQELLETMAGFANSGRMIAEQVWDREYSTDYNWDFGEGTGSATPLAWSMAQFVRLAHGIDEGEPVETPAFVAERYRERGLHEPDRGPALRVDTAFEGDHISVSGETTGALVAVKTPTDVALAESEDGTFECRVRIQHGENTVTVAAASDEDLERAGTTVRRLRL